MNIEGMLNQFLGQPSQAPQSTSAGQGTADGFGNLASKIPGGLLGGAAAGGVIALLAGNKSARKFAGKAATFGGAAVLGGLALKAYQDWQANPGSQDAEANPAATPQLGTFTIPEQLPADFEICLVKAMIAAAKADGHIDAQEQQRIFKAVEQMGLSSEAKALLFDLLIKDIAVEEIASGAVGLEQKTELYLASCLVIDPDDPREKAHLEKLATALQLPAGLPEHLQAQAQQALLTNGA